MVSKIFFLRGGTPNMDYIRVSYKNSSVKSTGKIDRKPQVYMVMDNPIYHKL